MKPKYTKRQIQESIAYWKKQLKRLDESATEDSTKCVAITQVIMAYMKHKISIDPEYLLDQVYQMASSFTTPDQALDIRNSILEGKIK